MEHTQKTQAFFLSNEEGKVKLQTYTAVFTSVCVFVHKDQKYILPLFLTQAIPDF